MGSYSDRRGRPIGCSDQAFGGAGLNLSVDALFGETEMITAFDDFNIYVDVRDLLTATAGGIEDNGFTVTQVGVPTNSAIGINDDATFRYDSCIRINCGDTDDTGANIQLIPAAGETHFPHIWYPSNGTATSMDDAAFTFACRVGVTTNEGAGDFFGKAFIGLARAGETAIMTPATGAISVAAANDILLGFHLGCNGEVGAIDGIAQGRLGTTAYAEATNFTRIHAAGALDSTLANGYRAIGDPVWFDLALRVDVEDMSNDNANGNVYFYTRRVPQTTSPSARATSWAGREVTPRPGQGYQPWTRHSVVLDNQTPNSGTNLVPTIEVINGDGDEIDMFVDWWAFGISRYSR